MLSNQHALGRPDRSMPRHSIAKRISYFLQLWAWKTTVTFGMKVYRQLKPTYAEHRPVKILAYSCRPHLHVRIFGAHAYKQDGELLPLYLDCHGGGHTILDAEFDDEFCSTFAMKLGIIVVSINYSLAPSHKFPIQTNDVVAIAQAVIDDPALNIDKSRVVLGGFSAGGNLSISAAQVLGLREKLNGVVAWYPVMDFTLTPKEKQASRPYRHTEDLDDVKDFGPVLEWGYIPAGHDLKDPLLSTRFVKRNDLPNWIYLVGAEYDMLADEARQTAFDLAGLNTQERDDGIYEFEKDTIKWTLVRDVRQSVEAITRIARLELGVFS